MRDTRKKILCIEDDRETAELIAEELVDRGFDVEVAYGGSEGYAAILRSLPDLVLSDIRMPAVSGFDILEQLTAAPPRFRNMPFVFLTAMTDRDIELKARQRASLSAYIYCVRRDQLTFFHANRGAIREKDILKICNYFNSDTAKVGTGYGLIAGRLGVAFDRLLLYTKLGVAFYDTTATITDAATPGFVATGSKSQTPFAVGGGAEYAIFDHWTGKAEYVFFDRGCSFNACGVTGGQSFCWKQDPSSVHTFKIGLNYKFW